MSITHIKCQSTQHQRRRTLISGLGILGWTLPVEMKMEENSVQIEQMPQHVSVFVFRFVSKRNELKSTSESESESESESPAIVPGTAKKTNSISEHGTNNKCNESTRIRGSAASPTICMSTLLKYTAIGNLNANSRQLR